MGRQVIAIPYDTHTAKDKPTVNFNAATLAGIGGSANRQLWLQFPKTVPNGAVITKAELHFWNAAATANEAHPVSVRRVTGNWVVSKLNYNNRPAVDSTAATASKNGAVAANSEWVVDIKALIQKTVDHPSLPWLGLCLEIACANQVQIYTSASTTPARRPYVVIEWSDAPKPPTRLSPSSSRVVSNPRPILRANFVDVSGNTTMQGFQVQIFSSATSATAGSSPTFDSGALTTPYPELDLSATSFPAMTSGQQIWWRCRTQDGAGLWSTWSAPSDFIYRPLPVVAFDALADGDTIGDLTPTISWTVNSGTQVSREIRVTDSRGRLRVPSTANVLATTSQSTTLPTGAIRNANEKVTITLVVHDSYPREEIPNGPSAARISATVSYAPDPTTDKPLTLALAQTGEGPSVRLTWTTKYQPDAFMILRDGDILVANTASTNVIINNSDGTYSYIDTHCPSRRDVVYEVRSIVNSKSSQGTTTKIRLDIPGIWLVDPRKELKPVLLADVDEGSWSMAEESSFHSPMDSTRPVLITATQGGFKGTISGLLVPDAFGSGIPANTSAATWRDRLLEFRERPGRTWRLVLSDYSLEILARDIQVRPLPDPTLQFEASFEFYETTPSYL